MNENMSSHCYYHFISFVKELNKNNIYDFAVPLQMIIEKIKYKNKNYTQILNEIYGDYNDK